MQYLASTVLLYIHSYACGVVPIWHVNYFYDHMQIPIALLLINFCQDNKLLIIMVIIARFSTLTQQHELILVQHIIYTLTLLNRQH